MKSEGIKDLGCCSDWSLNDNRFKSIILHLNYNPKSFRLEENDLYF